MVLGPNPFILEMLDMYEALIILKSEFAIYVPIALPVYYSMYASTVSQWSVRGT